MSSVGSHQEHGHDHVHRDDGVHHDVGHRELSPLLVNAEKVGKLVVSVRDHVYQEVRRGTKAETKDRISDCATDCGADGRVGCKRHNAGMIARNGFLGQVLRYFLAKTREERSLFVSIVLKNEDKEGVFVVGLRFLTTMLNFWPQYAAVAEWYTRRTQNPFPARG